MQKEEPLGTDALCIGTKTSFNWITIRSTEAGRLEYSIGSLRKTLLVRREQIDAPHTRDFKLCGAPVHACAAPQVTRVRRGFNPLSRATQLYSRCTHVTGSPHTHYWIAAQFGVTVSQTKTCVCGASIVFAWGRGKDPHVFFLFEIIILLCRQAHFP